MPEIRKNKRVYRLWATVFAGLVLGCSSGPEIPPLPEIDPGVITDTAGRERLDQGLAALDAEPDSAEANGKVGMQLHAAEQFELAAALYERAQALRPGDERWWYYHAALQDRLGNSEQAVASYRAALERNPDYLAARAGLARNLLDTPDWAEGLELYRALRQERPDLAEIRFGLGHALLLDGDRDAAVAEFEKAVSLFPGYGPAHYQLGLAYRDAGREAESREQLALYEQDGNRSPFLPDPLMAAVDALKTDASTYVKRGVEREAAGDVRGALAMHLRAVEADPDFHQAYANLVVLYAKVGDYASAEKAYRRSRELDPNQAELEYNFGVLAYDAGRMKEAKAAFARALEINPNYAGAHNNMGQMMEEEGRIDDAIRHYRAAIRNRPNYRLAHFHLGRMMLKKRRAAEAVEELRKTLEPEDGRTPQFRYSLAVALAATGQQDAAQQQAVQAAALARKYNQPELAAEIEKRFGKS